MTEFNEQGPSEREIRDALQNFEAPFDPKSWQLFEQKLNEKYTEEKPEAVAEVDKIVYPKIARFEADFSSKSWAILADRLKLIAVRKRQVWSSKLIESAIFLLLLANLPAWLGLAPEPKKRIFIPKNQAVAALEEPSDRHENRSKKDFFVVEKNDPASQFLQKFGIDGATADGLLAAASAIFPFPAAAIFDGSASLFSDQFLSETEADFLASENENATRPPLDFSSQLIDNQPIAQKKLNASPSLFDLFAASAPKKIASQNGPFLPVHFVAEKAKKRRFRVAAFASPQLNYVETIGGTSDESKKYQQLSVGYGGGVSFGSKKGRWGVETGLAYQAKNFVQPHELITGDFENYLVSKTEKIELEQIDVPLHLTCQIGRLRKTKITALAGNSLQIVAQKNIVRTAQTADPKGILANVALRESQKNQGLFEGGRLDANAVLTADFGLRIERPLGTSRLAFFVQPTVQTPIGSEGLGDQKAKITSFSLRTGIVSTL